MNKLLTTFIALGSLLFGFWIICTIFYRSPTEAEFVAYYPNSKHYQPNSKIIDIEIDSSVKVIWLTTECEGEVMSGGVEYLHQWLMPNEDFDWLLNIERNK